jgi:hypothetical protein
MFEKRRALMEDWCGFCSAPKAGSVVQFGGREVA